MDRLPPRRTTSQRDAILLGSSPSQSSLVYHSVPQHLMDRSALLALQDAYSNPQLLEDHAAAAAKRTSTPLMRPSIAPTSVVEEITREDYFSHTPPPPQRTRSPPEEIGSRGGVQVQGVDPSPLLSVEESLQSSPSSVTVLPANADPHKPLRRWLFDFPQRLDRAFYRVDSAVTNLIQRPLATVGGITTGLESEILEANEMATQARMDARRVGQASGLFSPNSQQHHTRSPSHVGPQPLRRSLAITGCNKALVALALLYTSLTTIELGTILPLFLYLYGADSIGTLTLLVNTFAAVFSQVFKRFLWRPRPWMLGRAITVKRDKTSSFPSRAVVCAMVYAYAFTHLFYPPHSSPFYMEMIVCTLFAIGAGISRIFVGAHFFSDCLVGFVLGVGFCVFGTGLSHLFESECGGCFYHELGRDCYAASEAAALSWSSFPNLNLLTLSIVSGVSIFCVGLAMSSPLHFWTKCTSIFGILFPCFAFRLVLLCPRHNPQGIALLRVSNSGVGFTVVCTLLSIGLFIFTKLLSKLTVLEHTVQLTSESQSNSSEEGIFSSALESSLLEPNDSDPVFGSTSNLHRSPGGAGSGGRATSNSVSTRFGLGHSEASSRHFLQFSSIKTMAWNLSIYFLAFATVFMVLLVWRIEYVNQEWPESTT